MAPGGRVRPWIPGRWGGGLWAPGCGGGPGVETLVGALVGALLGAVVGGRFWRRDLQVKTLVETL